jgi:hypothetical protein
MRKVAFAPGFREYIEGTVPLEGAVPIDRIIRDVP